MIMTFIDIGFRVWRIVNSWYYSRTLKGLLCSPVSHEPANLVCLPVVFYMQCRVASSVWSRKTVVFYTDIKHDHALKA